MTNEFTTARENSDTGLWPDTIPNENRRWSSEEDEVLLKYYPSEGSEVASRLCGRTVASCQFRAYKLGIKREQPHRNGRWQQEEDEILRIWYPRMGIRAAVMLPSRTRSAVQNRVALLGLHREILPEPLGTCSPEFVHRRKRKLHHRGRRGQTTF